MFRHRGEWYYVWAEKVGSGKQISNLYIAKMESANRLKTVQELITTPDYEWERHGFWVNEGPAVIKHAGKPSAVRTPEPEPEVIRQDPVMQL